MFNTDESNKNLSMRVKLRRWWKLKKDQMRWEGWRAFEPRWFNNSYYWIKDHLFPWNVIKIKSLSCRYADKDTILIHGAFQVLVDFVEGEWVGSKYHGKTFDLEKEEKEYRESGHSEELIKGMLESIKRQNDGVNEIWHLYVWWKYFRPNRDAQNPLWAVHCPVSIRDMKVSAVDEDGDPTLYTWNSKSGDAEKDAAWEKACDESQIFEKEESDEDEQMFIRLVKVREHMWT